MSIIIILIYISFYIGKSYIKYDNSDIRFVLKPLKFYLK